MQLAKPDALLIMAEQRLMKKSGNTREKNTLLAAIRSKTLYSGTFLILTSRSEAQRCTTALDLRSYPKQRMNEELVQSDWP